MDFSPALSFPRLGTTATARSCAVPRPETALSALEKKIGPSRH